MEDAGALVHGVVSDGASPNRKFWEHVGISGRLGTEQCFFNHPIDPDRKVFVFSDAPHLIKTIRNHLSKNKKPKKKPGDENTNAEEDEVINRGEYQVSAYFLKLI